MCQSETSFYRALQQTRDFRIRRWLSRVQDQVLVQAHRPALGRTTGRGHLQEQAQPLRQVTRTRQSFSTSARLQRSISNSLNLSNHPKCQIRLPGTVIEVKVALNINITKIIQIPVNTHSKLPLSRQRRNHINPHPDSGSLPKNTPIQFST